MKLVCQLFGHHRSKWEAIPLGDGRWRSVCRHCRAPMVRVGPKDWKIVDRSSDELKVPPVLSQLVPPAAAAAASSLAEAEGVLPA